MLPNSRPQLTASDMKALVLFFLCAPSLLERYHPQTIFAALDISAGIRTALLMHVQRPWRSFLPLLSLFKG